jgi:hypothetical protein
MVTKVSAVMLDQDMSLLDSLSLSLRVRVRVLVLCTQYNSCVMLRVTLLFEPGWAGHCSGN